MLALANFVMKGPKQAYLSALAFAILAVIFSPLSFLAGVVIALVTLRINPTEGFKVLAVAAAGHLAVSGLLNPVLLPGLLLSFGVLFPAWALAAVLRRSNNLAHPLQLSALIVGFGVVLIHLQLGDVPAWWLDFFQTRLIPMWEQAGINYPPEMLEMLGQISSMMIMMISVTAIVVWFAMLLTARWMQAVLYFPGQFQADFHQLRLPKSIGMVTVAIAAATVLVALNKSSSPLLNDLFAVLTTVLMFQGLAVIHHTVKLKELNKGWLVAVYFMLFVIPHSVLVLSIIGLSDQYSDFRNRWTKS